MSVEILAEGLKFPEGPIVLPDGAVILVEIDAGVLTRIWNGGREVVAELGALGVATVHEAAGRTGLLGSRLRPVWPGARMAGTAVTVLCWPGDNLMVHLAVEVCREGDVLVVAMASPSSDGVLGELLATSLRAHGVIVNVTTICSPFGPAIR